MSSARGLALLGPGLDGQLAIELVRRLGCEVIAATFSTPFTAYYDSVCAAASRLNVPLITLKSDAQYLERVAHPRFGYTREMAPCLDCKTTMLAAAREQMESSGATFLITGDVVGQRLPGQSKRDFALVDFHAGVEGRVLRPLCAMILDATQAETTGAVRRDELLDINGRSRQRQIALAKSWGWEDIPSVTSGCLLADAAYGRRYRDAVEKENDWQATLPLLAIGRHFRITPTCRAILGRDATENQLLRDWHAQHSTNVLLTPENFVGPSALLTGDPAEASLYLVAQLIARYGKKQRDDKPLQFVIAINDQLRNLTLAASTPAVLPAPI